MSVGYTSSKWGRILQLHDLNYSYHEIAKITGASKTEAQKTVKHAENHHTHKALPCSGRPAAIDTHNCHHVLCNICNHHFKQYKAVSERVGGVMEWQVCTIALQSESPFWQRQLSRNMFNGPRITNHMIEILCFGQMKAQLNLVNALAASLLHTGLGRISLNVFNPHSTVVTNYSWFGG